MKTCKHKNTCSEKHYSLITTYCADCGEELKSVQVKIKSRFKKGDCVFYYYDKKFGEVIKSGFIAGAEQRPCVEIKLYENGEIIQEYENGVEKFDDGKEEFLKIIEKDYEKKPKKWYEK